MLDKIFLIFFQIKFWIKGLMVNSSEELDFKGTQFQKGRYFVQERKGKMSTSEVLEPHCRAHIHFIYN